jgi:molybdopterin/thiamine biosynthesis adenylyltransferase
MKRKVSDINLALVDAEEFHLAMTAQDRKLIESLLHGDRAVDAAERGLMCVLTRSPGRRRLTYLVQDVIPPEEGDLIYTGGVEFTSNYRRRVKRLANDIGGGVLYLHTHAWGVGRPSRQDLESATRLLHNDAQHLEHANPPLAAGILTPDGNWMALGHEFPDGVGMDEGPSRYATAVRVVGTGLRKLDAFTAGQEVEGAAGASGSWDPNTQDRQVRLWTESAQEMYASLRVGIVGLGGGGSILAPDVARSGVDGLILADYDVVKDVNLNRQRGATEADASVWRPKVDAAARTARAAATNPDFDVVRVYGSVVEDDPDLSAYTDLLDCDVILHAADGHWTTRVLDEIAHSHLIPVISGGTRPVTDNDGVLKATSKSPITVSAPGQPCFRCCIQYLPSEARKERGGGREPGPDYNMDRPEADGGPREVDDEPAPSVMSLNEIVAGLMHLRLQDMTLGVTGGVVGERRYLPSTWDFERGRDACRPDCDRKDAVATGQTHQFPLSKDQEFEELRQEVEERFTPYW